MSRSLKSLKDEIRMQVFTSTEPENLLAAHDLLFLEGLGELQRSVDCLQDKNVDVISFGKTFHRSGMTVVPAPHGIVNRVYTVHKKYDSEEYDWSRPVFYGSQTFQEVEMWSRELRHRIGWVDRERAWRERHNLTFEQSRSFPAETFGHHHRHRLSQVLPELPLGFEAANPKTDSKHGRARSGIYTIHDKNLYLAPWMQSDEAIVIEWSGIKRTTHWRDEDLVSDAPEFKSALKLYFQYSHERDYGSDVEYRSELHELYKDALSELMIQCREETRQRQNSHPIRQHHHSYIDLVMPRQPLAACDRATFTIAHLGNNGSGTPDAVSVAAMVKAWNPDAIVTSGGDTFQDPNTSLYLDYDAAIGVNWSKFVSPYIGAYENEATENHFWPAVDDTDWSNSSLAPFKSFFQLPNNGRYYDFTIGPAHFFVIDSSSSDPDGNLYTSTQGIWLQVQLMLSTARWKIVVFNHPAYTSDSASLDANLQWPFDQWGVDIVLMGKSMSYERLMVNRFPFIVNGLGGKSFAVPSPQDANSVSLYGSNFGAGRLSISPNTLLYEFFSIDGTKVDSFQLNKGKERCMKPPLPSPSTAASTANQQIYTGSWTNPNGNVAPQNKSLPALYYVDNSNPISEWNWSVNQQQWFPVIT